MKKKSKSKKQIKFITMSDLSVKKQRESIREFMKKRNLKVYPWSKKAGVSEAALRAFLKGETNTMHISTLSKLAAVEDTTIDYILSYADNITNKEFSDRKTGGFYPPPYIRYSGNQEKTESKNIDPGIVVDATQLATELYEQGIIGKGKIKDIALEAAEIASNLNTNVVTKGLLVYLAEVYKNKK